MNWPSHLAVDEERGELYVANDMGDSILVFSTSASGNVEPIRVLKGPDTGLGARAIAVDPVRSLMVVAGSEGRGDGERFRIFNRTDHGNVKPNRIIGGPNSEFESLARMAVYAPKGWILAGVRGGESLADERAYLGIWSIEDNGDVPPRWKVGGPHGVFLMPRGVALNPLHKEVMVPDKRLNAVLTFSLPEIF